MNNSDEIITLLKSINDKSNNTSIESIILIITSLLILIHRVYTRYKLLCKDEIIKELQQQRNASSVERPWSESNLKIDTEATSSP